MVSRTGRLPGGTTTCSSTPAAVSGYATLTVPAGYVYGLDLQVHGEFVPGFESWVNYGFMVARERFLPEVLPTRELRALSTCRAHLV